VPVGRSGGSRASSGVEGDEWAVDGRELRLQPGGQRAEAVPGDVRPLAFVSGCRTKLRGGGELVGASELVGEGRAVVEEVGQRAAGRPSSRPAGDEPGPHPVARGEKAVLREHL
jgi:hypothetical protein